VIVNMVQTTQLRFSGSVWCNLDIALRNLDQLFGRAAQPLGLTIIEWYIMRALYERDGQHASELARAVGRAATSFTPNLDKLQQKGFIERRPDPSDRRAVHIYLTREAQKHREEVMAVANALDTQVKELFTADEFESFLQVLSILQTLEPDYSAEAFSSAYDADKVNTASMNGHHAAVASRN
jgi:DNA-binding MarR family transcriptional regulator